MALDAIISDLDGTLVDTNWAHVEAWQRAFEAHGFKVPPDRIAVEIGKGGDLLVPAILGPKADEEHGSKLRESSSSEFLAIAQREHFKVFPGVKELVQALRRKHLKVALATSSKMAYLEAILSSAGLDLEDVADLAVTADDAKTSKPAPDLVIASLAKLAMSPAQCAMIGDTPYDVEACRHAGVVCLGFLCGGSSEQRLRQAGARAVWQDAADMLAHLDHALTTASPGAVHWTTERLEALMQQALTAAREGAAQGERPIGCVLARSDGSVVARGSPEVKQSHNRTAHAALVAFARASGRVPGNARDLVLCTTVEPCVMCTGAALAMNVDMMIYGCNGPDNGSSRVTPPERLGSFMPRIIGQVLADECRELLQKA